MDVPLRLIALRSSVIRWGAFVFQVFCIPGDITIETKFITLLD